MSQRVEGHVRTQPRVVLRPLPPARPQVRVLLPHAVAHPRVVGHPRGVVLLRPSVVHHSNDQVNVALQRLRRSVQPQNVHVDPRKKVAPQAVSSNPLFPSWLAIPGAISVRPLRVKFHQIFAAAKFLPKKPTVV